MGPGVDERHAQPGAHQRELARAVVRAVVHVQALRDAAAQQGLLEHGQERLGVLGHGEGAVRHDTGGVVEEGDQVGLAPRAGARQQHAGAVHDVAHPQLSGVREGEAAPVLSGLGVAGLVHEAGAAEQPVHRRRGRRHGVGCRAGDGGNELRDRQLGPLLLQAEQRIGHRLGQRAGATLIGAALGQQGVEAAAPPGLEPVAQRLGGHPDAAAAGDRVIGGGLLAQPRIQPAAARGQVDEIGDQSVAEQGCGLAILAILGIGHGFGLHVVEESPPYAACRGGSGPLCCWSPVRCSPAPGPRWRNPRGYARAAR